MKVTTLFISTLLYSSSLFAEVEYKLALTPPMGWNSFDSYGVYLHEKAAFDNLEELAKEYKKHGYEYFVIDNGWFGEYKLRPGTFYSLERHAADVNLNEYGILQPSKCYFPNGFSQLVARCHQLGLKFGLHLMRGIPRKAYEMNLPIKGTNYTARDIVDLKNACSWCQYNYGVDMSKPGGQEFYNSLIQELADWGVDFLKVDDIVPFPAEVEAIVKAIKASGRDIVLSLSPGDVVPEAEVGTFKRANMLRVTADVWDTQNDINKGFAAMRKWNGHEQSGFWIDMDMIPFGQLQLMSPSIVEDKSQRYAGKGNTRQSKFTKNQQLTFITQRALAASPLMIGGDLPTMDSFSKQLLTNEELIACNQNGVMAKLLLEKDNVEVWRSMTNGGKSGWIGIFNRTQADQKVDFTLSEMQLSDKKYHIYDIWNKKRIIIAQEKITLEIPSNGVIFLRYK